MLNRIALTGIVIKGQKQELVGKFIFPYSLGEGGVGYISGDGPKSTTMWHTRFFDSLLYEFVEILDTDELLGLSPRMSNRSFMHG